MTDRFKNKCFKKDARSYLLQAFDWSISLCRASSWGKIKAFFLKHHSSVVGTAVSSYSYLLVYFEVQCTGRSAPTLPSIPAQNTDIIFSVQHSSVLIKLTFWSGNRVIRGTNKIQQKARNCSFYQMSSNVSTLLRYSFPNC